MVSEYKYRMTIIDHKDKCRELSFNYRWWTIILLCTVLLSIYIRYREAGECCCKGLWSLHASLFNVMQDLCETLESWQCLTWAVLITVMARILIKSLFTYPGACSSVIEHHCLAGLHGYGLVNTDSCSSQPQPRPTWWVVPDMLLNTATAAATVRNRSILQGRKTSMSNQWESAPRVTLFRPSQTPTNQAIPSIRVFMGLAHNPIPALETGSVTGAPVTYSMVMKAKLIKRNPETKEYIVGPYLSSSKCNVFYFKWRIKVKFSLLLPNLAKVIRKCI